MDFEDLGFPLPEPPSVGPSSAPAHTELPPPQALPVPAPALPLAVPQARPRTPYAARAKAGLGAIVAAAGAGAGGVFGGPLGALAGLTGVGAVRNLYRAQAVGSTDPSERADAARSLVLGIIGVAILGVLGYKLYKDKKS